MRPFQLLAAVATCAATLARAGLGQPPSQEGPDTPEPALADRTTPEVRWPLSFDRSELLGVHTGVRVIRGPERARRSSSVRVAIGGENATLDRFSTSRGRLLGALGGGGEGLEGQLMLAAAAGAWGPLGEDGFGPFARLGAGLRLEGSQRFYRSDAELPRFEAGLLLHTDALYFELNGSLGHVLNGFFNMEDAVKRRLGPSPVLGGAVSAGSNAVALTASARRVYADRSGIDAPVDDAELSLCYAAVVFLACLEARAFRGETRVLEPPQRLAEHRGLSIGAVLGFGDISIQRGARAAARPGQ